MQLIDCILASAPYIFLVAVVALGVSLLAFMAAHLEVLDSANCINAYNCINNIFSVILMTNITSAIFSLKSSAIHGLVLGIVGLIFGDNLAKSAAAGCNASCQRG